MKLSNTIKQRFVKDYKLPIQVVQEPMFSYYINELDSYFQTKSKLQMLIDVVTTLGGEDQFFAESNKVKDTLIQQIQSQPIYTKLANNVLDEYTVNSGIKQQDIYNMGNDGKTFISVDLKHANFNVFKMYDPSLVLNCESYEELVGTVTQFDYFKKSKYLRQVIFGNVLPKKQQRLQKWVMDRIITVLHNDVGIPMDKFVSASADEVVFEVESEFTVSLPLDVKKALQDNTLTSECASWMRVETFDLKSIGGKKYFVKEHLLTDEVEFKAIPSLLFMQVFKKYNSELVQEYDKVFFHEGFLSEFRESLFED